MSKQISSLARLLPKTKCKFTWREHVLTETDWDTKNFYDLSTDLSFEKALAVLSEDTSFYEKLAIAEEAENNIADDFNRELYFKESNYTRFDLIEQIAHLSKKLPNDFLNWCSSKKLNLKDFRAFLNDYKKENDQAFFSKIYDLDPTKNTGLQIIELYFDLCAQNKITGDDLLQFKKAELLLNFLKKQRFSNALSKDQLISDELSKIKIAAGVKAALKRNGDKRQIRIEIEADSPEQLKAKLEKSLKSARYFEDAWNTGKTS